MATDNDTVTITGTPTYTITDSDYVFDISESNSDYVFDISENSSWDTGTTLAPMASMSPSRITLTLPEDEKTFIGGMEVHELTNTIRKQRLEIEALTDILSEIVTTGEFKVDMDLEERVLQKQFLEKLAGDNNEDI